MLHSVCWVPHVSGCFSVRIDQTNSIPAHCSSPLIAVAARGRRSHSFWLQVACCPGRCEGVRWKSPCAACSLHTLVPAPSTMQPHCMHQRRHLSEQDHVA